MNKIIAYIAKATGLTAQELPVLQTIFHAIGATGAIGTSGAPGLSLGGTGPCGPQQPPVSNEHVAEGCEQFSEGNPADYGDGSPDEHGVEATEVSGDGTRRVQYGPSLRQFVWATNKGSLYYPREMVTQHLFYTIRMLFNHSVPPAFRVGQFKRHDNVFKWSLAYKEQAAAALREEFLARKARKDGGITHDMRNEMSDMEANAGFLDLLRNSTDTLIAPSQQFVNAILTPTGRRLQAKAKRMRRAVDTRYWRFPGKRCMEHRSYAGIRKPRVDCNACKQVYNARKRQKRKAK